jgi:hypothetical protein
MLTVTRRLDYPRKSAGPIYPQFCLAPMEPIHACRIVRRGPDLCAWGLGGCHERWTLGFRVKPKLSDDDRRSASAKARQDAARRITTGGFAIPDGNAGCGWFFHSMAATQPTAIQHPP